MVVYLVGYVVALVAFGAIDALWLRIMGPLLYRPTLGDILLAELRVGPAIAFYLFYPLCVLVLAVLRRSSRVRLRPPSAPASSSGPFATRPTT